MVPLTIPLIEDRVRRGLVKGLAASGPIAKRAAVAIVLRTRPDGEVEVLLIQRAERAGDPWSGHAAFPGGRVDAADASIDATAIRETREELGLDHAAAGVRFLGRLPDFTPLRRLSLGMSVTPVVFEVAGDPPFSPDPAEVAFARWVPLSALRGRAHAGRFVYWWRPWRWLPFPIPFILECWRYGELTIWGLTRRMLTSLFDAIDGQG